MKLHYVVAVTAVLVARCISGNDGSEDGPELEATPHTNSGSLAPGSRSLEQHVQTRQVETEIEASSATEDSGNPDKLSSESSSHLSVPVAKPDDVIPAPDRLLRHNTIASDTNLFPQINYLNLGIEERVNKEVVKGSTSTGRSNLVETGGARVGKCSNVPCGRSHHFREGRGTVPYRKAPLDASHGDGRTPASLPLAHSLMKLSLWPSRHSREEREINETDFPSSSIAIGETLNSEEHEEWIKLNVGGQIFATSRTTLCTREPSSMLARMFCSDSTVRVQPGYRDETGAYIIDRSPKYFEPILNYLRHGELIIDNNVNIQGVFKEAEFFGIESLLPTLELETELLLKKRHRELQSQLTCDSATDGNQEMPPLTRKDVVHAIMSTSTSTSLRLQGCNLAGANLSKLDLSHANMKYANLRGANLEKADLSHSNLEEADLYESNLVGAQLTGARLQHANLENSNLSGITIDTDIPGSGFQRANLKNTNFEGSYLAQANFSFANLEGSNVRACNLRIANFSNANLRNCDLRGSSTPYTRFDGANTEGALFH